MGEHIDEVDDEHIEVVLFQVSVLLHELVSTCRVVDLVIGEAIVAAVAFNLCFDERCLVEVLPLFFVFIHPQVREHRRYLPGHQTTEDGVACILCGGRQNAHIEVFLYVEHIADFLREDAPLIEPEVVNDDEKHFLPFVYQWEHLAFEDVRTKQRTVVLTVCLRLPAVCGQLGKTVTRPAVLRCHPVEIVLCNIFGKAVIGFFLLHFQHLGHVAVGTAQLQFPVYKPAVDLLPVAERTAVSNLHGNLLVALLITALRHLCHNLLLMDVLLERQKNLIGIDRLDEIVGDFRTDGLVHDILFLALCHHDDRRGRLDVLYPLQRFESRQTRHLLIKQYEVERLGLALFDGIRPIAHRNYFISFLLKEDDVGFQQFDFIIHPE